MACIDRSLRVSELLPVLRERERAWLWNEEEPRLFMRRRRERLW